MVIGELTVAVSGRHRQQSICISKIITAGYFIADYFFKSLGDNQSLQGSKELEGKKINDEAFPSLFFFLVLYLFICVRVGSAGLTRSQK